MQNAPWQNLTSDVKFERPVNKYRDTGQNLRSRMTDEETHTTDELDQVPASKAGSEFHIVCVGASAGGLEALENLFGALPADLGIAFVVVQHLSPDFKSHMETLLARHTSMPIHRVENGMQVEPNCIYLIPPKMEMVISGHKLLLTEKAEQRSLSHPIDQFLRSLASDIGRYAMGVILSGTGSDGSRGIKDVHDAGGLVMAQDVQSAKFDGMPMNAESTGSVDLVLPPAGMAEAIVRYVREGLTPETMVSEELLAHTADGLDRIFQLLNRQHNLDFSHYKATTVGRRVQRRIDLLSLESVDTYVQMLEDDPGELNDLYKDLLIGVTTFFRDPAAFEILEKEVIPKTISRLKPGDPVRIWVAGCATGEEAYSIAILMDEALRKRKEQREIKIFATDAHHVSLHTAAKGVFPETALSEMTDDRKETLLQSSSRWLPRCPRATQARRLRTSQRDSRCAFHSDGHRDVSQSANLPSTCGAKENHFAVSLRIESRWSHVSWAK